jgi:hypothetical protein
LSASRRTTGAVTEVLSKKCVVSLHAGCGRCVAVSHCAVDHVKAWLSSLVQPQLEVSSRGRSSEVNSAPFNVEDPVGRSARHRGEDTASSTRESRAAAVCVSALVIPVREDRVVVTDPRQRTDIGKGRIGSRKLRIAVGRYVDAVKGLVVQSVRERQRNVGYLIVPVIAAIGRPWHDAAAYLIYHVRTDARRGRWS